MPLRTLSIQVGRPAEINSAKGPFRTAILKEEVQGAVELRIRALVGDGCADRKYHGLEDQAVCVYPVQHFAMLSTRLGCDLFPPGGFGENFTVEGGDERTVRVGEVYRVGTAWVEVTKPRKPCSTLNRAWGLSQLAAEIGRSGATGWYLRVLRPGTVQAGDVWKLERPAVEGAPTIAEAWRVKRGGA
ncbi:MAG: MOSC domain-containing protein [Planctomycetes bacterium]|nr:MOSC domain-containing protein [Planctomycetota bacterium]